jgi:hypothetical protein
MGLSNSEGRSSGKLNREREGRVNWKRLEGKERSLRGNKKGRNESEKKGKQ